MAPTLDPQRPTELPDTHYDVAVFENRFPSLTVHPGESPGIADVLTRPALGRCEVVVFARDADMSLSRLSVDHIALIMEVWADRTEEMKANGITYVLPFENRGVEMGVTLHHPHGQIYGYGFLPAQQRRASENLMDYQKQHGKNLIADLIFSERASGTRLIRDHGKAVAFVPSFARFPYESWIVPERHVEDLAELDAEERQAMAAALKDVLQRLDALWDRPMPYLLTVNQAPTDGSAHPEWTMRIEIWPIRRAAEKLKFLAGTELGAGVFVSDIAPEIAAANLRAVKL